MPEITAITPQIKDKKRCNIYIDGRFYCGLTLETVMRHRLKAGMQIATDVLSQMQLDSEKNVAFDKALHFLSSTSKTEGQVRDFLEKKGYLPAVCNHVIEKLRGYDFVNDGDYAKAYVNHLANKKGVRLLKQELKKKGVADEEIDEAMSTLDEDVQKEAATAILQKYMRNKTPDKETLYKAFKYLLGKGFEYDIARAALSAFGDLED